MSAITEDVKSTAFADLTKFNQTSSSFDEGGAPIAETEGPDLATLENQKKEVQRRVNEHESFWSWFCYRCCYCDGHSPSYCYWGTPGDCSGCSCDCCDGDCCGDCDCSGCDCGGCDCSGADCGGC